MLLFFQNFSHFCMRVFFLLFLVSNTLYWQKHVNIQKKSAKNKKTKIKWQAKQFQTKINHFRNNVLFVCRYFLEIYNDCQDTKLIDVYILSLNWLFANIKPLLHSPFSLLQALSVTFFLINFLNFIISIFFQYFFWCVFHKFRKLCLIKY